MKKREFLCVASAAAADFLATPALAQAKTSPPPGPALLTVTGAIIRANRGPLDPALDQLMAKQKLSFDKAWTFDYASLQALPQASIRPVLEYDEKAHTLSGPLLADVLAAAGGRMADSGTLLLRAIDGYAVTIGAADFRKYRFIVATHLDGKPMPLGGLGPLWAVYDADRFPDMAAKPVKERFGLCPWALYHINVQTA
jgi:hypothetical protein